MFLRFSKGKFNNKTVYTKCALLGDTALMEYDDKIVGVAERNRLNIKVNEYVITIASKSELHPDKISRCMKDFIGKSYKFRKDNDNKKRKYYVVIIDLETVASESQISLFN